MTTSTSMPGPGRTTARRCRSSSSALSTKRYRPRSSAGLPPDGCSTSGPAPGAGSIVWDKDGRGWRHRPRPVCRDVERRPPGQSPAQPRPWERRSTALPQRELRPRDEHLELPSLVRPPEGAQRGPSRPAAWRGTRPGGRSDPWPGRGWRIGSRWRNARASDGKVVHRISAGSSTEEGGGPRSAT